MELLEREGPLTAMTTAWTAAAEGRGSVILVDGEPGIGKTALVTAFVARLGQAGRVLLGTCDDLAIPRPLGPIRELAEAVSAPLAAALRGATAGPDLHALLLEELRTPPHPATLILEDMHWADEATVDAVTVLGRRVGALPLLMILTYRGGELGADHGLRPAMGALRAETSVHLRLPPLSRAAVATLAGENPDQVYAVTGGNPFYVTELATAPGTDIPASVTNTLLGRTARLSPGARRLVELVSVVPARISTAILDHVLPTWTEVAEEPERRQLLTVDPRYVAFRHELARAAIRSSLPAARRRRLHSDILAALQDLGADAAEIVHHAEEAGDTDALADHVLAAARQAAAVESNREAYAHYRRATRFADRWSDAVQASLFEELAVAAYTVDRVPDSLTSIGRAIEINRRRRAQADVGRCTRILSRCQWFAGDGEAALSAAREAVRLLQPLGDSVELARAYSSLSQLAMLAAQASEAMRWGERAVDMADRIDDPAVKAHALINIGSIRMQMNPDDTATLLEAHRLADEVGDRHEAVRALLNLGFSATEWAGPQQADHYTEAAIAYAEEHQVDALLLYARVLSAWLRLRAGAWDDAERLLLPVRREASGVAQLFAEIVGTELAVRRGDPDVETHLRELAERAAATGELQRLGPLLQLETEWALTKDLPMPAARVEQIRRLLDSAGGEGWASWQVAAWAAVAGESVPSSWQAAPPQAAMIRRDWASAAESFGEIGWLYERALMLSLLDDEAALTEALAVARRLAAQPLIERVTRRMRELGLSIPRGPRPSTLSGPAGLTRRQVEVLRLLADGLTNAEIASQLFVSTRTVEHHVEAIFTRLGVANRREAAHRFGELAQHDHAG